MTTGNTEVKQIGTVVRIELGEQVQKDGPVGRRIPANVWVRVADGIEMRRGYLYLSGVDELTPLQGVLTMSVSML